jgi:hypothetical protein
LRGYVDRLRLLGEALRQKQTPLAWLIEDSIEPKKLDNRRFKIRYGVAQWIFNPCAIYKVNGVP